MPLTEQQQLFLASLPNRKAVQTIHEAIELLQPSHVFICTDSEQDHKYVAQQALERGEEITLATRGHTIHWDGPLDQARDKAHTAVLLPPGSPRLPAGTVVKDRMTGLAEVQGYMRGSMRGSTLIIAAYCLGPADSIFSKSALQFTDSWYVAHSQNMLYRAGWDQLTAREAAFYYFLHAMGPLDARGKPSDVEHRRVYVDPVVGRVYSYGCSYAGNTLACKKLALRLAIYEANQSDWLTEHMFLAGFQPPQGGETVYVAGAFPSSCGKTSSSMLPGSEIVGDDILYLRSIEGKPRAVNIEQGCFGIIRDVCERDDPLIYRALTTEREVIFSNLLAGEDGKAYWAGMAGSREQPLPARGESYEGAWEKGSGRKIAHPNSRYTLRIEELPNASPRLHDPAGVPLEVVLYGGRDAAVTPPVLEALSWAHGVWVGSSIESETTAATLGKTGVLKSSPMANMDFLIVPFSSYIQNHLDFGTRLGSQVPRVFGTNYFRKGPDGRYLNDKTDKLVWVKWACGRARGQYEAIRTPVGLLPHHADLAALFRSELGREYTAEQYAAQFDLQVNAYIAKLQRIWDLYSADAPAEWRAVHEELQDALHAMRSEHGDVVPVSVYLAN
eukprot:gnl/Dysnectes_brevis/3195_a3993_887.p1 GENE.gnl/Dysnectes_brevis/3195_a3993_887~~gnl/Dysnectes_brevis/3195_a3993_887.p1  ORF type:complete len:614 (+),score=260.20 gnl/Dysnectes_brevis/3195_a3993_887:1069-2910(+)